MSIVHLYKAIEEADPKNPLDLANSSTIDRMMGFSPVETVVRDVVGADDKLFRTRKLV